MTRIAIVGMACRYPDATSPAELWANAVAGRRAFRRLPEERIRLEDYWDADPSTPDTFYARNAAVLEGYSFDRVTHRIAGSTFRSTDMTHWLALDTAGRALADAGFPAGEGLPHERTGVVMGNTLTGEFTRANVMRLRWPYVRRVMAAALAGQQDWDEARVTAFLEEVETSYKAPFPAVDEDTLAGGLSNTIAGRICNHFDLNGGGYTVDGACSSSLLSVTTAGTALVNGDLDVAVAGGVDLSIDPFEIIGFAKTGALARGEMKLYDKGSNGFWPGEGCGVVVLMREEDAIAHGHRIYATVAGWGVSSDGQGGITRPEVDGYRLALERAYARAGFGIETVPLFEGHGTGTAVGDATELTALMKARSAADPQAPVAAIGSIKGMIGHTKAAAGVAGLIKATLAVDNRTVPPSIGTFDPHELLTEPGANLKALRKAEVWSHQLPRRAGITAMGFGGINTHVVLDEPSGRRRSASARRLTPLADSVQDSELLLFEGASARELSHRLTEVADYAVRLSYGELADLAATLQRELRGLPYRAAAVVTSPDDADNRLRHLVDLLDRGEAEHWAADGRTLLGKATGRKRIGLLFPGQGSGRGPGGGALGRRFPEAAEVLARAASALGSDTVATEVAQPRIVSGSAAGLRVLDELRVEASVGLGHSLGELSALCWAGSLDEDVLIEAAGVRGRAMAEHGSSGTMASLGAAPERAEELIGALSVVVAGYNGPEQTVVSGPVHEVEEVRRRAARSGVTCTPLAVSHAFHSPLVASAAESFGEWLKGVDFREPAGRVVSTVTGAELTPGTDLSALLREQITAAVRFTEAVRTAAQDVDLFIEVGPGRVLSHLAGAATNVPAVSLDTDDESLRSLLKVVGAAFVVGAPVAPERLFRDRLIRPLRIGQELSFLASPCEQAPATTAPVPRRSAESPAVPAVREREPQSAAVSPAAAQDSPASDDASAASTAGAERTPQQEKEEKENSGAEAIEVLSALVVERAELPAHLVGPDSRLLDDLHLSSITVGQIVNQAMAQLGIAPAAQEPANFATATLAELAEALESLASTGGPADAGAASLVAGAAPWARPFAVDLDEVARPPAGPAAARGTWELFAPAGYAIAGTLRAALQDAEVGSGVLVCLPPRCSADGIDLALAAAKRALAAPKGSRFVLVQHGRAAAGLVKTLHQEASHLVTTVVDTPLTEDTVERVVAEVSATIRFSEVHYGADGVRRVPTLRALPLSPERQDDPLGASDVLLVTGGGKGISAECALAIAQDSGARLAVLGRSDPATDRELADNLKRMEDGGVTLRYARADVTSPDQVRTAVAELRGELGPITGVLHGAGRNEPGPLHALEPEDFRRTFAPKVDGLRTVLDAVDAGELKLLVTFGSIIGRAGLRGEAHYATANEWLADLTEEIARTHPQVRARCVEWSVWSGVGMGEKLSVVESLSRQGIVPVSPDQGVEILLRLIRDPGAPVVTVVSGRTEGIETVRRDLPPLPLLRFTGTPLVRYHGVELVTEVELNAGTDPYLGDHLLDGNLLLPAVMGMEAMVQVAAAATGRPGTPVIEGARFLRPIVVPPDGSTTIRVAATVTGTETVDVAIHARDTGFAAEHFRARLVYSGVGVPDGPPLQTGTDIPEVPLDPAGDLYGGILFQGSRFQRLRRFHRMAARHVDADVTVRRPEGWFAGFLPAEMLLADPGMRDALMHGNQVCVPDATLLPSGVERIHPLGASGDVPDQLRYCAVERSRDGDTYVYDIAVRDAEGTVVERWEGLTLHAVRKTDGSGPWVAPLLGPHLERTLEEVLGAHIAVTVEPHGDNPAGSVAERRAFTTIAASRNLGAPVTVRHRPDGRPEVDGGWHVSASHGLGLTVSAMARAELACDIEAVSMREPGEWQGLLGEHAAVAELVARETGEAPDTAATRVWSAVECLRKAGAVAGTPLTVLPQKKEAWVVFTAGDLRIATFVTALRDALEPAVFAFLTRTPQLLEGRSQDYVG
ncbi:type I polyketide synthase [Streptomyces sp. AD681]|uniref:type I polyketide synthase n=1 Tax=Streptomyces sp. AD681 TaxID=3019069 RepID=UPI0022F17870|nr:type I polyketide synthase [Streptomyces sp. AD681]MDA5145923.1 type I polyketide synthase [Streptomyces sp. AD681]